MTVQLSIRLRLSVDIGSVYYSDEIVWKNEVTMGITRFSCAVFTLIFYAHTAFAQMTPEDLKKQIDARSSSLNGFQELLDDPDPRRSLAAVEGMLASGDSNLERMALEFALTNPDATIRATALAFHLSKLPSIAVEFDASAVAEDQAENLADTLESLGGSIGPDKKGSFSFKAGPYSEELGCYPQSVDKKRCAMRLGAGSLSLYFSGTNVQGRWANLYADETGVLKGGVSLGYASNPPFSVPLTVRLLN